MGEKKGFFGRLAAGLSKTRKQIASGFDSLFSGFSGIDDDFYEELEEILIMADLGMATTEAVIEDLKDKVKERHIKDPAECKELLKESICEQMSVPEDAYEFENRKSVVLVIGVNGVGKTTSIGKLAGMLKNDGKKVLLAAADTFRAAAAEQLRQAIVANPDKYFLHIAMKATTQGNHQFYTFNDAVTSFAIGTATIEAGAVMGDFKRDGSWAEFDIPMANFAAALANIPFPTGGNIFCALSGAAVGSQLNLDAVYFYEK